MRKILIALSTFNRKNITRLCLENLKEIVDKDGNQNWLFMMMHQQITVKNF